MFNLKKIFSLSIFFLVSHTFLFAEEQLTITTYYPSPAGSYYNLYVLNRLGIGTTSPTAKLTLYGTNGNYAAGPHLEAITTADAYPNFQLLAWTHDNINFGFDTYYNGSWISSSANGNFNLRKTNTMLEIRYASGVTAGSVITWNAGGFVLTSGGNVGIGTTSPSWPLHIQGPTGTQTLLEIENTGTAANDSAMLYLKGGNANAGWLISTNRANINGAADSLGFYKNAGTTGTKLVIQDNGSVGIGTTAPGQKLSIAGGNIFTTNAGGANGFFMGLASDWNSGWGANEVVGTYRPKLFLASNGDVSGTDYAVIDSSGNLGIGTTSPGAKLQVGTPGAAGGWQTGLFQDGIGIASSGSRKHTYLYSDGSSTFGINAYDYGASVYLPLSLGWGGNNVYIAQNGGNVGIGTTAPGAALDVNGAIKASSGFAGPMYFPASVGGSGWLAGIGTGAAAANGNSISIDTLETMRQSNGQIDGTLEVFNYYPGQTLHINGVTWCTSGVWSGSDIRWKKNIETLNNPLPKLLRIRGVTFNWKSQEELKLKNIKLPEGRQIGVIAQEVEKEFPELINIDKDGYKGFSYDKFSVVLLEAIKEQQNEIESLKQKIAALEAKLNPEK